MKKLILLLAVVVVNASAFAQSGAKIEFKDKDNTIDYGKVTKESDSGVRTFEFKNTGNAPLIITNVQSTCGCTVPTRPTEPIMPGKTGKIDVKYNMNPGPIRKTITVESNAVNYEGGRVPLKIKGEVIVKEEVNLLEKKKSVPNQ
jgi:LEA14-like dessication related protein